MSLTRSEAVLKLGKRLVRQLDADDDLLASWMAHYIAQRIKSVEDASGKDKAAAQKDCARAILELWNHRRNFPRPVRPFEDLESVVRTLNSLDVEREAHRYFPRALHEAEDAEADQDTRIWLELALGLDYSARLLIRYALATAARSAASDAQTWVELARQAGAEEGPEGPIVRFVLPSDETGEATAEELDAELMERVSRLESFVTLASRLAEDLRAELGSEEE